MDSSAEPAPAGARDQLVALGFATLVLITAATGLRPLARLVVGRFDADSRDTPFHGWQVDAVLVGLGVVLVTTIVVGAVVVRRHANGMPGNGFDALVDAAVTRALG